MMVIVTATNAEDVCEPYCFSRDLTNPDTLIISERWHDQAAVGAHFRALHMSTFNAAFATASVSALSMKAKKSRSQHAHEQLILTLALQPQRA
jgi:quinol monooxygenase YgiN